MSDDSDTEHKEPLKKRKSSSNGPATKKKQAIDDLAADTIKLRDCLKNSSMLVTNAALEGKRVNQLLDGLRHQRERIERETDLEKKAIDQFRSALEVKKRLYEEHEQLFQQWEQRLRSVLTSHPALPDGPSSSSSSSDAPIVNGDVPSGSSAPGGKMSTPGRTYHERISRQQTLSPSAASTGFDFIRTATVFSQGRFDSLAETF